MTPDKWDFGCIRKERGHKGLFEFFDQDLVEELRRFFREENQDVYRY